MTVPGTLSIEPFLLDDQRQCSCVSGGLDLSATQLGRFQGYQTLSIGSATGSGMLTVTAMPPLPVNTNLTLLAGGSGGSVQILSPVSLTGVGALTVKREQRQRGFRHHDGSGRRLDHGLDHAEWEHSNCGRRRLPGGQRDASRSRSRSTARTVQRPATISSSPEQSTAAVRTRCLMPEPGGNITFAQTVGNVGSITVANAGTVHGDQLEFHGGRRLDHRAKQHPNWARWLSGSM
ncbi:MAG: hypothetical protein WDO24_06795 [Pseudomonadota bacterium]